jgi:alanine racemase
MQADSVTILEISLPAIVANWRALDSRHPGATAAVLKADGYGLGAAPIARALAAAGCRHFFVATPNEAVALRDAVPGAFLAVLNGLYPNAAPLYAASNLTPVLGSLTELAAWQTHAKAIGKKRPAMLHIDTGMNRLGLSPQDLAKTPDLLAGLDIAYVMTHLLAAERPDDPSNERQLHRFIQARAALPAAPTSIANSSGLFLGPAFASDLARPGAAVYGLNPTPDLPNPMTPVVRLRARVLQVREVKTGESVGYNACWIAPRPSRIATLPVGYADGFLRSLTNRGAAHFDGRPVPLVGRVSMDLTTFDITDYPAINVGTWLDLIGPDLPADALADLAGTNGYEILTSLGARYPRLYLERYLS